MKTPTWGTTIGIIMIVLGGCGAMNDFKSISMPNVLAMQRETVKKRIAEEKLSKKDTTSLADADSVTKKSNDHEFTIPLFGKQSPEKMLDISPFTETWIVRFGYIGAIASLLYMLGGIFLLVRKNFSIKLAYSALVLSILCSGMQAAVLTSSASGNFLAATIGMAQIPGILIDIILLAVIFSSDKDAYAVDSIPKS